VVRTRKVTAVVLGVLVLVLSGCDSEAGPKTVQQVQNLGPDALPIKLDALTADDCFLSPSAQPPKGCEKFVTELGNTAGSVRERGLADKDLQLGVQADRLDKAVASYRSNACNTVTTTGNGPCGDALTEIAGALTLIKTDVGKQGTTG
jgi:hypothetical protein